MKIRQFIHLSLKTDTSSTLGDGPLIQTNPVCPWVWYGSWHDFKNL